MKEHPILFSIPMVQAILDGRKTQTRRITGFKQVNDNPDINEYKGALKDDPLKHEFTRISVGARIISIKERCPYGQPGDLLWVRETHTPALTPAYLYKADGTKLFNGKWKPSIHMPKTAARIWLRITEVKVERLHNTSEESCIAEGIETKIIEGVKMYKVYTIKDGWTSSPKGSFSTLWEKINGTSSLKSNPWVWVVKFEVLSTTGKPQQL